MDILPKKSKIIACVDRTAIEVTTNNEAEEERERKLHSGTMSSFRGFTKNFLTA